MTLDTPAPSEVSATAGRRSACRKPIGLPFAIRLAESFPRSSRQRTPVHGGLEPLDGAVGGLRRARLNAYPRLRLGHERAELVEENLGGGSRPVERLDPLQPRQHGPRLLHLPTVASAEARIAGNS